MPHRRRQGVAKKFGWDMVRRKTVEWSATSACPASAEQLLPLVYDEFRRLAAEKLAQEKPGPTLQAMAFVHQAHIRLVDVAKAQQGSAGPIRPSDRKTGHYS
jgi:hypothetical protein